VINSQTLIPFPSPKDTGEMASDIIAKLGAPITPVNLEVVSAWGQAESATFPGYNLLGTELYLPGATRPAGQAVYDYPTLDEGLTATRDMMLGEGPQTTPLATQFVSDLKTGTATKEQLTADVRNSGWDGSGGDTYDANAIASKLGESQFSTTGSPGSASNATLTSAPGGALDPLNWFNGSVGATIGVYILKGVLTLMGAGLFLYGASLTAKKPELSPISILSQLPKAAVLA
jgi:hypothetical protein